MDKILKFKLWGDYAHFKKYYTTTSPLTFEFPPPPTLLGIISAIIGLGKSEYLSHFQNAKEFRLAVCINNPLKKVRWTQNLIDTKHHFNFIYNRTQIRIEFLKDPSFTVCFWHQDNKIYQSLKHHLKNHTSIYSISLGLSELLANYEYLGEPTISEKKNDKFVPIDSVIPVNCIKSQRDIDFGNGQEIFQVNFPVFMNSERVVEKRTKVIFERNANSIKCNPENYWQIESGEKVVFF
jgi:CRISPR-associated protein Cas5h